VDGSFERFLQEHSVGDLAWGRVDHVALGEAALLLGDDVYGMVPVGEVRDGAVLTVGEELWVKITEINSSAKTILVSVRQAAGGGPLADAHVSLFPPDAGPEEYGVREPRGPQPVAGTDGVARDDST
jgi:hypothetical protein